MRKIYCLVLLLLMCGSLYSTNAFAKVSKTEAKQDSLPVPKGMMFYVQRDPNANTVIYELNKTAQGSLDENEPIHPFWIRYAEGGEHKELNYIQRKFAYGLNTKKLGKDSYELKFVCYSKLALYLRKGNDGAYHVLCKINNREAVLDRIFVRIEGGTFWVPNVLYVELKGRDAATGKMVTERFKP
ncbi:CDP-alcohol phosphatidyltransferase [Pontibacter korlensis]|uniref:CDP-alcohol phosphatidyltransferase n=1 Tax=Pontibacter korlensis TaxID=400092 RepID=A0A0E3ZH30_9BACT|nr:DUF4833 domain-containing protein [Pontibacter korlensis]AKD04228.1 CDP-alcohol phosphatidyltransferase [Pontibacter korlensis]